MAVLPSRSAPSSTSPMTSEPAVDSSWYRESVLMPKALFTIPWVGLRRHTVREASERAAPPDRAWGAMRGCRRQHHRTGHGAPCGGTGAGVAGAGSAPQAFPARGAAGTSLGGTDPGTGSGPSKHLLPVRSRRGSRPMSSSGVESMMSWTSDHSSLLPMPGGHSGAWVGGGQRLLALPVAALGPPCPETPGQASVGGRVGGGSSGGLGGRAQYLC